jgi:hypothetical protein
VLAVGASGRLTDFRSAGKTDGPIRSKQGMNTSSKAQQCCSPGPPVDVRAWRSCRLLEAGFPGDLADSLAAGHVDLHALLELVDAGCPPDLAARILSPMDEPVVR